MERDIPYQGTDALESGFGLGRRGNTGLVATPVCTHLDQIAVVELPTAIDGCEECLKLGSSWLHLRMCMTCGKIGCCDSSPNRHASRHARDEEHPIARSAQPGEDWSWCYLDEIAFVVQSDAGRGADH